jgi:hypothetical protein
VITGNVFIGNVSFGLCGQIDKVPHYCLYLCWLFLRIGYVTLFTIQRLVSTVVSASKFDIHKYKIEKHPEMIRTSLIKYFYLFGNTLE